MTQSFCPRCNKDQPTIDAGSQDDGAGSAVIQNYQCSVCRTPVGQPWTSVQRTGPAPAAAPPLETVKGIRG